MRFKIFPCDNLKRPLIDEWQTRASNDQHQIAAWQAQFGSRIQLWGIPTGSINNLLVLDIDRKKADGFETIKTRGLFIPDSRSQVTMNHGAHVMFNYPRDGRKYGNRANMYPGIDVRGEGGYICHYDDSQQAKPILEAPEWLLQETLKSEIVPTGNPVKFTPQMAHDILRASVEKIRQAPDGESNAVLNGESFKVGQLVSSGSLVRSFAFETLMEVALQRKGLGTKDECIATINSGLDGGTKKPVTSPFDAASIVSNFIPPMPALPARWTPPKLTIQELLDTSKLRKPQLFEHWSTEDITITTADGGTGKTTLKLYEAICLALGERFLGFRCINPGKTLFITGEDTAAKLAAMIGKITIEMGLHDGTPENNAKLTTILESILIKKDADLCLVQKNRTNQFLEPSEDAFRKLNEAIEDIKPKMVVLDPISSFWGSEAGVNDMNKAVTKLASRIVEQHHVCFEMINHMGKQSSNSKDMSQFAGRGGTGLPSNSRVSRVFRRVDEHEYLELTSQEQEPGTDAILVQVNKFTDGSPLYNKPFIILRDEFTFRRIPLSKSGKEEVKKGQTDEERVFAFVKSKRLENRFVTKAIVVAHFSRSTEKISDKRTKEALQYLSFEGYMGEKIKLIQNPDQEQREQVYVIVDQDGNES